MAAIFKTHKNAFYALILVLLFSVITLTACENTYRGAGRDIDEVSDEMQDGWN